MSKFDAAIGLGITSGLILLFLWVYGLCIDAPKAIRVISQVISCTLITAVISFVVYCILMLVG